MKAHGSANGLDRYLRKSRCGCERASTAGNRFDLIGQQGQGACCGVYGEHLAWFGYGSGLWKGACVRYAGLPNGSSLKDGDVDWSNWFWKPVRGKLVGPFSCRLNLARRF